MVRHGQKQVLNINTFGMKTTTINAIKWIDSLPRYRKGVGKLYNPKDNTWCCLGVGCDVLNVPFVVGKAIPEGLAAKVDLHSEGGAFIDSHLHYHSLWQINDKVFGKDTDFTNMRAWILDNIGIIFEPATAKELSIWYGKRPWWMRVQLWWNVVKQHITQMSNLGSGIIIGLLVGWTLGLVLAMYSVAPH